MTTKPRIKPQLGKSYKDENGNRVDIIAEYVHPSNGAEFLGLVYAENTATGKKAPCRYTTYGTNEYDGHDDPMKGFRPLVAEWDIQHELRLALIAHMKQFVEMHQPANLAFRFDTETGVVWPS